MNKRIAVITASIIIGGSGVVATAGTADAASKPCVPHTEYTVGAHYVPEHTVKANAKHSEYTMSGHMVAAHVVKAKVCPS